MLGECTDSQIDLQPAGRPAGRPDGYQRTSVMNATLEVATVIEMSTVLRGDALSPIRVVVDPTATPRMIMVVSLRVADGTKGFGELRIESGRMPPLIDTLAAPPGAMRTLRGFAVRSPDPPMQTALSRRPYSFQGGV